MDASRKPILPKHLGQAGLAAARDLTASFHGVQARPDPSVLLASERDAEFGRLFLAAIRRQTRENNTPKRSKTQLHSRAPNAK
jgi:hypothetical protein